MGVARHDKKRRQDLRKMFGREMKEVAEMNGRLLKPKPRWVPMFVWIRLLGIFVYIKK